MFQRLLSLVFVTLISGAAISQDVMSATDVVYQYVPGPAGLTNPTVTPGKLQKWIHDDTQRPGRIPASLQDKYKCYYYNGQAFRLKFPKNYNPNNPVKYPCVVFLHGAGEAADFVAISPNNSNGTINRENQDQLFHGASIFSDMIDNDQWNGFLLFPQVFYSAATWDIAHFPDINNILDTLQKYNNVDPDRITAMGLSAGGYGGINYAYLFPRRIAGVVSANPRFIETLTVPSSTAIDSVLQIPIWIAAGGVDNAPDPGQVNTFRDALASPGGNIYYTYYATQGHGSWYSQWGETDINNKLILFNYWNDSHKAQPVLYYQNSQFCAGSTISAKMGISRNFAQYEWQYDGGSGFATIAGATSNTYVASQAGSYRVHFKRTAASDWSAWTPKPIAISTKACSVSDTVFVEHFETTPVNSYTTIGGGPVAYQNSSYYLNNYPCQNGIFINSSEVFSQDASGRQGGKFMMNNTNTAGSCVYYAGDQVWRTVNNVNNITPGASYTFSFYIGNQITYGSTPTDPVTKIVPKINGTALSSVNGVQAYGTGNISWKKYTYLWTAPAGVTSAEIAITNNNTSGTGNDFVLDEISLVKYRAPAIPGGTFVNVTMWSKANTINNTDGNPVSLWRNDDYNGNSNSMVQSVVGREPVFKSNSSDNINFNPVVSYAGVRQFNYVIGGFSGTATHAKAHVYAVTKFNNANSVQTLLRENQTSGFFGVNTSSTGAVSWNAGDIVTTNDGLNETGKTILWTFSKDNISNTGDNTKQDIRKNGILVASTNTSTPNTFKGKSNALGIGMADQNDNATFDDDYSTFNGSLAEMVILLDSTVTAAKENKIESYLAIKYGTTLGNTGTPRNYTASDGTIFWTGNAGFQNDVFGIGRDSLSSLLQIKSNSVNSGSGDGTGQSAKGNIILSTNATLLDKKFLMIGNDAAALTEITINTNQAPAYTVGSKRLARNWKVINTGMGPVDLSFDTTGLANLSGGSALGQYALMVDNDGNGNYNDGSISFLTPTGVSGKKLLFPNITLINGAVFTVITNKLFGALPAVWLGFTAEAVNGDALLNWKTSDEINVDSYVVEHSFNGISFTAIGSVNANNSSGVNNYTLTDKDLAAGIHYYRIRRVDKDGKSEYSDTKSVKISVAGANVQLRPNPVAGATLLLSVTVPQNIKTYVQIMSVDGKLMLKQNINLLTGNNLVNLNIDFVPSGIYLLQVQLKDEMITKKFIRQH